MAAAAHPAPRDLAACLRAGSLPTGTPAAMLLIGSARTGGQGQGLQERATPAPHAHPGPAADRGMAGRLVVLVGRAGSNLYSAEGWKRASVPRAGFIPHGEKSGRIFIRAGKSHPPVHRGRRCAAISCGAHLAERAATAVGQGSGDQPHDFRNPMVATRWPRWDPSPTSQHARLGGQHGREAGTSHHADARDAPAASAPAPPARPGAGGRAWQFTCTARRRPARADPLQPA